MTAEATIDRRDAVKRLLDDRGDLLVVAGLGAPSWDVAAAGDTDLNFPLWGAMGGASMVGLGIALARPERRVIVVTGDGEMLMGLGGLATIAVQAPQNLAVVVIDNESYGETGMQPTHTAHGADLSAVAKACGFPVVATIRDPDRLDEGAVLAREARGPVLVTIKVTAGVPPLVVPPRDGVELKERFRRALGAETVA